MNINIRPIDILDLSALIEMEMECFPYPWDSQDFIKVITSRKCKGWVVTINKKIVAYGILRFFKDKACVVNIAVAKKHRRKKIATYLINRFFQECISMRKIYLAVSEKNLEAQLFFKSCQFKAVEILKNYYGAHHDAFKFVHSFNALEKDDIVLLDEACKGK